MTQLVALCTINRVPPNAPPAELAGFDEEGNSIVRAVVQTVQPGELFDEPNQAEVQWLLDAEAVREPTAQELEMFERVGK